MSKNVIVVPKQTPTVLMVPRKAVKQDLITETNTIVYMPLATKNNYGVVKIGEGLVFDDSGSLVLDQNTVPILKIAKNGVEITPDENKLVNLILTKSDVGLSEADNTSDENKPLSLASREALAGKVDLFQGVDNVDKILMVDSDGNVRAKHANVSLDESFVTGMNIRRNWLARDTVYIQYGLKNLKTLESSSTTVRIPLATDVYAGLMSYTDYNSLRELQTRVGNLEQKPTRLLYDASDNPTAEEINTFANSLGYFTPFEGISVVVEATHHIWHFYEGDVGWRDDGLDIVSNFTNETAGVIKGTIEDGKIYAETDGTGSVYGWDAFKEDFNTLSNDVVRKTDYATYNKAGVVISTSALGTQVSNAGYLQIVSANEDELKAKTSSFKPIVPSTLDKAIKIGLTTNTETWSDTDKSAARNLIGAVGTRDYATDEIGGVLRGVAYFGFKVDSYGRGTVIKAEPSEIDAKESEYKPIVPSTLDYAVKKALTDNKLEGTNNAWTDDDKTAVKNLLGAVSQVEYSKDQTFPDDSDAGAIGRLYMRFRDNTENSIVAHCQAMKYTVPVRDSSANFYVGDPTQPYHCANVKSVTALTGTGAPTENTKALYIGQLYQNTTDDTMYQCTFIDSTNKIYTWKRLIRETDIANTIFNNSNNKYTGIAGLIMYDGGGKGGIFKSTAGGDGADRFRIKKATFTDIDTRTPNTYHDAGVHGANHCCPITPANIDYAVKKVLTQDKLNGYVYNNVDYSWTDDEKTQARNFLGVIQPEDVRTINEQISNLEIILTDITPDVARALKIPISAPSVTKLVGVDPSNAQTMISIGDGLALLDGSLTVIGGGSGGSGNILSISVDGVNVEPDAAKNVNIDLSGKVDKVTEATNTTQVYAKNNDGSQSMLNAVQYYYEDKNGLARFINGNLIVNTPTEDAHATHKKYVDENFVAKNKRLTGNRVYVSQSSVDGEGNVIYTDNTVGYATGEQASTLALRGSGGTLAVGTPTNNAHAVNKKYAEDNFISKSGGTITGDLTINGKLIQQGETYETHAEQVYSTKDYIYLRAGNTGGLAEGDYSGFEFINYDGEGNNGRLVVDKSGVARVGDVGDEQPLATREDKPLDGGFAKWDSATNKFITTTSDVVTISGDQTIGGTKSFENEIRVVGPGQWEGIAIHNSNYALGDTLTTQIPLGRWITYDKNGTYSSVLQTVANVNNVNTTSLASIQKNTDGSTSSAQLSLWAIKDGVSQIRTTGHLMSNTNAAFNLGAETLQWKHIYFNDKLLRNNIDLSFNQLSSGLYQGTSAGNTTGHGRISDIDFKYSDDTRSTIRHDIVSSAITTNRPKSDGYLTTYFWDSTYKGAAQMCLGTTGTFLQYRGMHNDAWSAWKTVANLEDAQTFTGALTFGANVVLTKTLKFEDTDTSKTGHSYLTHYNDNFEVNYGDSNDYYKHNLLRINGTSKNVTAYGNITIDQTASESGSEKSLIFKNNAVSLVGTNPSVAQYIGDVKWWSKENAYLISMQGNKLTNGAVRWSINLRNNSGTDATADNTKNIYKTLLRADLNKDGSTALTTITPSVNNNSDQIATTAWVRTVAAVKDLSNVTFPANTVGSTTTGSGDRVVETYISTDGRTWYRKWKSGWKECGIVSKTPIAKNSAIDMTLPIKFTNRDSFTCFVSPDDWVNVPMYCFPNQYEGEDKYLEGQVCHIGISSQAGRDYSPDWRLYCCGY